MKEICRRSFMRKGVALAAAGIGALVGFPALAYLVTSSRAAPAVTRVPLGKIALGPEPVAVALTYTIRDTWRETPRQALVYARQTAAGVEVLSSRCTHLGCTVRWDAGGRRFACPCHGSAFDAQGQVLHGPAERPLARYPVGLQDGQPYVELT